MACADFRKSLHFPVLCICRPLLHPLLLLSPPHHAWLTLSWLSTPQSCVLSLQKNDIDDDTIYYICFTHKSKLYLLRCHSTDAIWNLTLTLIIPSPDFLEELPHKIFTSSSEHTFMIYNLPHCFTYHHCLS